ncbi:hypothetical protein [Smaragdicoccus niigatensis]|uniref:hypothetical protein n=1 Tax=Smaragdicoccus niigatensis TaxID=359359 RepID=UPI00035D01C3|nr:hypothetical protein [Smaragdicoccus niigatensis]
MSDVETSLAGELGAELPPRIAKLGADGLSWLLATIQEQTQVQVAALDQSCKDVVANLPMILRGPARAIIGG